MRPGADPHHGRQEDRPVPRLPDVQRQAHKPADAVNKEIAQYGEDTAKSGVLGTITPHPSGADTIEAAFLLFFQGHSPLDAYAAVQTGDAALAKRAWAEFYGSDGYTESSPWKTGKLTGPATPVEGSEAAWVSTDDTALYGLAAIEDLALLGDEMPA
ncbi:hypothetical protein GCM10010300_21190 [Streptomyces olivaceoviridis]|nr:hypothetical protein GCM10010300_21190 [Streptomyces olivaceoviridis]